MVRGINSDEAPSGTRPRWMKGVEKVAVVAGEHVVAVEQHGGADPDRDAVDGGDDRLDVVRQRIEEFYRIRRARHVDLRCALLEEILDIVAGGEHAGAAGDDNAADFRVVLRGVDGIAHRAIHLVRDRVLLFRPPQRDDARAASSVTIRCPVMTPSLGSRRRRCRWRVLQPILHDLRQAPSVRVSFSREGRNWTAPYS